MTQHGLAAELHMRIVQPIALAAREHLGGEATSRSQIVARLVPQGGHRARGSEAGMGGRVAAGADEPLIAPEAHQPQRQHAAAGKRQRRPRHAVPLRHVVVLPGAIDVVVEVERRHVVVAVGVVAQRP